MWCHTTTKPTTVIIVARGPKYDARPALHCIALHGLKPKHAVPRLDLPLGRPIYLTQDALPQALIARSHCTSRLLGALRDIERT